MDARPETGHAATRIVCAALGGRGDARAARLAGQLAERLGLSLTLLDVRTPVPATAAAGAGSYAAPSISAAAWAPAPAFAPGASVGPRSDLDRLAEEAAVPVRRDEIDAPQYEALKRIATDAETELLVVRDDGGGAITSRLSGSAGRDVVRDASSPVVLVPDVERVELPPDPDIICALDDTALAETVAAFAGDLAERLNARLQVFHVVSGPSDSPGAFNQDHVPLDPAEEAALDALFDRVASVIPPRVQVGFVMASGTPSRAVREFARVAGAALVIVGRPDHGVLLSALRGSVAHALLRDPVAPVVVVPDALHASRMS